LHLPPLHGRPAVRDAAELVPRAHAGEEVGDPGEEADPRTMVAEEADEIGDALPGEAPPRHELVEHPLAALAAVDLLELADDVSCVARSARGEVQGHLEEAAPVEVDFVVERVVEVEEDGADPHGRPAPRAAGCSSLASSARGWLSSTDRPSWTTSPQ